MLEPDSSPLPMLMPRPDAATVRTRSKHLTIYLAVGVALSSGLVGGLWASIAPQTLPSSLTEVVASIPPVAGDRLHPSLARPATIALLGVDPLSELDPDSPQRFEGHSDTLALIRFDPETRSIHLLSIPRDTRVEIPGYGFDKINRANLLGGTDLTIASLETLLRGVTIDRVLRVDLKAARQVIDQLGGLELHIERPMQYVDRAQDLTINLEPGWQLLSGAEAIQFARYRDDGLGDIGRVQRQQQVFDAMLSRLRHPAMMRELPSLIAIVQDAIETDLRPRELLALADSAIEAKTLQAVMLPGRFSQSEDGYTESYWLPDTAELDRIRSQFFATTNGDDFINDPGARRQVMAAGDLRVAVQDATGEALNLRVLTSQLKTTDGTTILQLAPSETVQRKTLIVAQTGNLEAANLIQEAIGCGLVTARSTGAIGSDVTVYLGRDCLDRFRLPSDR
ncbi:MAG: LCP family protein [Coleofasciculaceae cyanobacterium RL_1_1]|nr:LCP family protein [Coleofasciculaceae cyanobacterium RL_1_1]